MATLPVRTDPSDEKLALLQRDLEKGLPLDEIELARLARSNAACFKTLAHIAQHGKPCPEEP